MEIFDLLKEAVVIAFLFGWVIGFVFGVHLRRNFRGKIQDQNKVE